MNKLEKKLKALPKRPGVYFFKNKSGEIIYIGKAANLRNRVKQYFQASRLRDAKTELLIADIADAEWQEAETELDALFLEAELIRRYIPHYNILLRDDKSFVYVRIDLKSDYPSLSFTRRPLDDGAEYIGPFLSKLSITKALRYLRKIFPYSTHAPTNIPKRACLQAQIGLCPGLEAGMITLKDYRKNLKLLIGYITGKRKKIIVGLEKEMKQAAKNAEFEKAAQLRNKLYALKSLDSKIIFGDRENLDISKDSGLAELARLLGINIPRRIEGFDVSHQQGSDTVASMVVFIAGVPDKNEYRKFKSRIKGNDDYLHIKETMTRRFSEKNIKKWGKPDLILIDGGKGQANAALGILNTLSVSIPLIGLAKRFEEIILPKPKPKSKSKSGKNLIAKHLQKHASSSRPNTSKRHKNFRLIAKDLQYEIINITSQSDALKLLQRIRDESHRFAVSYHSSLKRARQTASMLDQIPGIGPVYRKKLIKKFGSSAGVAKATRRELEDAVGARRARLIKQTIG